jgi:retron-type reverse transcriptase
MKAQDEINRINNLRVNNKISNSEFKKLCSELILKEEAHLTKHTERNQNTKHINYKIYYLLENPFTIINAYSKISKNKGALTKGFNDSNVIQYFGKINAENICKKLKTKNYQWQPVRRTCIPKPGKNKLRPIDTLTQ